MSFIFFEDVDVVRHTLVQRIVRAYERYNQRFGTDRQLTLRLGSDTPEPIPAESAEPGVTPAA
jgi:phosphate starvation-inducible PhoH-like protein